MQIRVTLPDSEPRTYEGVLINKAPIYLLTELKVQTKFGLKAFAAMEEDGDPRIAVVMAYLAMRTAGESVRYADLEQLCLDDLEIIRDDEDEPAEAEGEGESDPQIPAPDSAQGESVAAGEG